MKKEFLLNPDITFLNHGSFGATPIPVFNKYQEWQRVMEFQPVEFLSRKAPKLLEHAREILGKFLGTSKNNLVYVTNTTTGINIIARSLKLGPGDHVLTTDHEYGAMDRVWRFLSSQRHFKYTRQPVTIPLTSKEKIIDEIWQGVSPSTKVIYFSHISSPTAITFPVKEICERAKKEGIITIVDGAHAPGQIDLNLDELQADFYAGNLHKWLCAPKGTAFLFARPEMQFLIDPLIIGWGWDPSLPTESHFVSYLEHNGTRDISAFLTVPEALNFYYSNNISFYRKECHSLTSKTNKELSSLTNIPSIYNEDDSWFGQMASTILPQQVDPDHLKSFLYDDYHIEIPLIRWNGLILIRYSFHIYNCKQDAEVLMNALSEYLTTHAEGKRL